MYFKVTGSLWVHEEYAKDNGQFDTEFPPTRPD